MRRSTIVILAFHLLCSVPGSAADSATDSATDSGNALCSFPDHLYGNTCTNKADDRCFNGTCLSCSQETKQKSLYGAFTHEPPLEQTPAFDMMQEVQWMSPDSMYRWNNNGIYDAFMVKFAAPEGTLGPA